MICPSVQDLSPTLHVASLVNERILRGCQEPTVENNKIEHVTKIECAMVNMDRRRKARLLLQQKPSNKHTRPASQT